MYKKVYFLILLFFSVGILFSQDISIGTISIVGGEPACPSDSVNFQVQIVNNGAADNDVNTDVFYFQVNGPINRPPSVYTIDQTKFVGDAVIEAGTSQNFIFPTHFSTVSGTLTPLDLSNPTGPYTITASITIPGDTDISNNVSTSLNINIHTPVNPTLSSNDDTPQSPIICAGDEIIFTISPPSATATYTFKVNGGIVQSIAGVNTITFSSGGGVGSIADGDIVTFDMIDSNGCVTNSATQSITVSVNNLPLSGGLSSSATDGLFCEGDTVNFTATGGVSYTWYLNGAEQFGATFSTFSRALTNSSTVKVRIYNAARCYVGVFIIL